MHKSPANHHGICLGKLPGGTIVKLFPAFLLSISWLIFRTAHLLKNAISEKFTEILYFLPDIATLLVIVLRWP